MALPPHLLGELPGLEAAFDEASMRGHLQAALFGAGASKSIEQCAPGKPLFLEGEGCTLQYECRVRDAASGAVSERIVIGHLFPDRESCARYLQQRLEPLVERVRGRPDLMALASPAAVIEPMHMVVCVWPIDGEMPALIDATDPRRMLGVLAHVLGTRLTVGDCRVELVSYRRRTRCVLRYVVRGVAPRGGEPERLVLYGKLTPLGDELLNGDALAQLRAHFEQRGGDRIVVPRSLGWRPELGLVLLDEVPGEARIGAALRARLRDKPPAEGATLEAMVATSARVAAAFHGSGLPLGRPRTLESRLADLEHEVEIVRLFSPELAERARVWLERLASAARRTEALPPCLCHGDFTCAQVLFDELDGGAVGVVDLDNLCQAEPALDAGRLLASVRVPARKAQRDAGAAPAVEHELCERFLGEYAAAMALGAADEGRLRARMPLHEVTSMLRGALNSQQKLKHARLDSTAALIEERLSQLA